MRSTAVIFFHYLYLILSLLTSLRVELLSSFLQHCPAVTPLKYIMYTGNILWVVHKAITVKYTYTEILSYAHSYSGYTSNIMLSDGRLVLQGC